MNKSIAQHIAEKERESQFRIDQHQKKIKGALMFFKNEIERMKERGVDAKWIKPKADALNTIIDYFNNYHDELLSMANVIGDVRDKADRYLYILKIFGVSDVEIKQYLRHNITQLQSILDDCENHEHIDVENGELVFTSVPQYERPFIWRYSYEALVRICKKKSNSMKISLHD